MLSTGNKQGPSLNGEGPSASSQPSTWLVSKIILYHQSFTSQSVSSKPRKVNYSYSVPRYKTHTLQPLKVLWQDREFEKTQMLGKMEGGRRRGDRGWDGWMASPTQWRWVWVNSGSWWWTGRPGVLQSMGSQRVGHDWATGLNWLVKRGITEENNFNKVWCVLYDP